MAELKPMGQGEKRLVAMDFSAIIPSGATVLDSPAPTITITKRSDGSAAGSELTGTTPSFVGTICTFTLTADDSASLAAFNVKVEATLDNGEEVQGRDDDGEPYIVIIKR